MELNSRLIGTPVMVLAIILIVVWYIGAAIVVRIPSVSEEIRRDDPQDWGGDNPGPFTIWIFSPLCAVLWLLQWAVDTGNRLLTTGEKNPPAKH